MPFRWTLQAELSLLEILNYYELEVSEDFAETIEDRIFTQIQNLEGFEKSIPQSSVFPNARKLVISKLPYVAFIREVSGGTWEVVDIVHTARKLPR